MSLFKHGSVVLVAAFLACGGLAHAQDTESQAASPSKKPNILLIVSDDTGWGDLGPYLGGEARGMQTPNCDRLARQGMVFTNFYGQPSCTPGRAAIQSGRIPNRSGMTTVAFQGQGGGLSHAEWTLGSSSTNRSRNQNMRIPSSSWTRASATS
jgi:arylsulfatase